MAPSPDPDAFSLDIGYPVYGAQFASDTKLIVAGGGGEGKNGVANKISVLNIDPADKKIEIAEEKVLSKDEDSPMSLDITEEGVVAIGVNSSSATIKTGKNEHLRLFKLESDNRIETQEKTQLFKAEQPDEYQKCTRFSPAATYLAVASSAGILHSLSFPSLKPQFRAIDISDAGADADIQDVDFSCNEKLLAYTTPKSVTLLSAGSGEKIAEYYPPPASTFRGVRFASDDTLVLISNHARRRGASILKLTLPSDIYLTKQQSQPPTRTVRGLHAGIKAVTALDCRESLACVAGADLSVAVVRTDTLREVKIVRNAHSFPVTRVVMNSSGTMMASTSVAQSVVVVRIEGAAAAAASSRLVMVTSTIVSIVVIVIIGVLVQLLVQRQVLGRQNELAGGKGEEPRVL
ncbi:WD40-repeat-containing domain protein [Lipomyces tetrasporus]